MIRPTGFTLSCSGENFSNGVPLWMGFRFIDREAAIIGSYSPLMILGNLPDGVREIQITHW
jgi:hypothetical protein